MGLGMLGGRLGHGSRLRRLLIHETTDIPFPHAPERGSLESFTLARAGVQLSGAWTIELPARARVKPFPVRPEAVGSRGLGKSRLFTRVEQLPHKHDA